MDARRKKRQGLVVEALPIFGQATAAVEPGDGALDDPAFGQDHKSADPTGAFDDFNVEMRQNFCKRFRKFRPLISAVGEERLQKGKHPEQCRHNEDATIAILNVGRMNDGVEQEAYCVDLRALATASLARWDQRLDHSPHLSSVRSLGYRNLPRS